jgi:hypothetical protein
VQGAEECFGGGALKEGSGLGVNGSAEKIVFGGVTNIEVNVGSDLTSRSTIVSTSAIVRF